MSEPFGR